MEMLIQTCPSGHVSVPPEKRFPINKPFAPYAHTIGTAWDDLDNDGDLGLVNSGKLFVNQGNDNHWLKVKVDGISQTNVERDAIGTQVKIDMGGSDILVRQVESGTGTLCSNDLELHFGLGTRTDPVDLTGTPRPSRTSIRRCWCSEARPLKG